MITKLVFISCLFVSFSASAWATSVYVESNQASANSLLGFQLQSDGSLLPKESVTTGGKGVVDSSFALGPFDSDQEVIVDPVRKFVFAVNSGSNSVAVFRSTSDGVLTPVPGSPFDSHGINPVSVGLKGDTLIVVNKHGDPAQASDASLPNYTTFNVLSNGTLEWLGSSLEVASGSSPSQALVSPFESVFFGADFLGGILRSVKIESDGALISKSALGLPAAEFANAQTPRLALGLAAHPSKPLLYVGLPTANKIGVYNYSQQGELRFSQAVSDSGNVVCWLMTNREGTRLYASNTGDPSITVYDIASNPESPQEIEKLMLPSVGGSFQLALSPDGKNLLVLIQRDKATIPQGTANEIHVLDVDQSTGKVQEAKGSPTVLDLPGDTRPQGLIVF